MTDEHNDEDSEDLKQRKWFVIGVGGTGGNLVDSILLRKKYLNDWDDERIRIWNGGLQGVTALNTHRQELENSYYAKNHHDDPANDVARNHVLGPREESDDLEDVLGSRAYHLLERIGYQNGVGNAEPVGASIAEVEFQVEDDDLPVDLGTGLLDDYREEIQEAQSVMLLHSVIHGTGSGTTPVVAEKLKNDFISPGTTDSSPLYSCVVIPSERNGDYHRIEGSNGVNWDGSTSIRNALIGLGCLSQHTDVIIPFSNYELNHTAVSVGLDDSASWYFNDYVDENSALVAYLEALSMSSIPGNAGSDAVAVGNQFDITDPYGPLIDRNPCGFDPAERPASIIAPALGRLNRRNPETFDKVSLEQLLNVTFGVGKLGEFDESTCWGGVFLYYYPEQLNGIVRSTVEQSFLDIVKDDQFFALEDMERGINVDVGMGNHYFVQVKNIEDVHLWAGIWNPKIPPLDDFEEWMESALKIGNERADRVEDKKSDIQALLKQLGREPLRNQVNK